MKYLRNSQTREHWENMKGNAMWKTRMNSRSENEDIAWVQWLMPEILATWEVESGGSWFKANPGK
jgi:hypothetical protein